MISIYPVLANSEINLLFNVLYNESCTIIILDVTGVKVKELKINCIKFNDFIKVDLGDFDCGRYYIKIKTFNDQYIATYSFLKL